jgi:hypothetical protein
MAKQTINIGSSEQAGDGESLRSAFDKINDNFDELYLKDTTDFDGQFSSLAGTPTTLAGYGITDAATTAQGALAATAVQPQTSLSGYGITDAYTKAEVDSEIATATASLTIQSGSTHSIDIVAADSTVLVDSVNGTLNATTLTGALPAIDGSALTGITTAFSNITSTPTTISGYGISDAQPALVSGTNIKTVNGQSLLGSGNIVISGGGGGTGDVTGSVFADDSTLLVDGVNGTLNSSALTKPIALADNEKIIFGSDNDLEIFHNASNGNTIIDNNTGNLVIKGSNLFLQSATSEYFFRGAANGAVTIYHDNVAKFETTADGISVTDHIALPDGGELRLGSDNDMQISHSGISGLIRSTTGSLVLQSGTVRIQDGGSSQTAFSASNGIATLLFENSAKLATTTNGVTITGDTTVSGNLTAGTGTVGGLTFAGTQIASDDSTQISFQDNIEIAGGPVISGSNLSHTGTFTINPYALSLTTTGGNVTVQASNYVILDSTNNGQINIGQASGSGDVLIGNESNGTSISLEGHTRIEAGVEESFTKLTGQSGVVAHDCSNGYMFYHTGMTGDITANFTNLSLASGHATNLTVVIDQGGTEYEITAVQIGGAAQTIVWQNNNAPTGTANGVDSFSFTILNDGGSYVVLGQMVSFGGV